MPSNILLSPTWKNGRKGCGCQDPPSLRNDDTSSIRSKFSSKTGNSFSERQPCTKVVKTQHATREDEAGTADVECEDAGTAGHGILYLEFEYLGLLL